MQDLHTIKSMNEAEVLNFRLKQLVVQNPFLNLIVLRKKVEKFRETVTTLYAVSPELADEFDRIIEDVQAKFNKG